MPSIPVRAALCAALLATPLLVLAQSSILPQQRDAAGTVMEPLGQVLIASETGPSGLYDCTRDGNWCVRVQPVAEEGDRPSVLEVLEKVQGQGKPHTYHVSIDVPQEADLSLWPWIVRLASGVGSDETVTDPQQRARQNVQAASSSSAPCTPVEVPTRPRCSWHACATCRTTSRWTTTC